MPNLCEEDVMNHVFKVVWSKTKHCYVVVSELAGMQGKKSRSEKRSVQRSSMSSSKVSAKWLRAPWQQLYW